MKSPVFLALFLTISLVSTIWSGTTIFDGQKLDYDDDYSLIQAGCPDWSGKKDLDGKVIYAITFNCGEPDTHVFPDDMVGVSFYNANLDNVYIPPGNQVINFNHAEPIKYKAMNDGEDWKLDPDTLQPVEPVAKDRYIDLGISTDPMDIPQTKLEESITTKTDREKSAQAEAVKP